MSEIILVKPKGLAENPDKLARMERVITKVAAHFGWQTQKSGTSVNVFTSSAWHGVTCDLQTGEFRRDVDYAEARDIERAFVTIANGVQRLSDVYETVDAGEALVDRGWKYDWDGREVTAYEPAELATSSMSISL